MATPEQTRGWLAVVWPLAEKSTPVTLLFLLLTGILGGWLARQEIRRVHDVNRLLWERLLEEQKTHLELALRCDCKPR